MNFKRPVFFVLAIALTIFSAFPVHADSAANNQTYWVDAFSGEVLEQLNLFPGEGKTIRLMAEVPEGQDLNAYQFEVIYDSNKLAVEEIEASAKSNFPPMNINSSTPGKIVANSFDLVGLKGKAVTAFIDVIVVGKAQGDSTLSAEFSEFGDGKARFIPKTTPLKVITK